MRRTYLALLALAVLIILSFNWFGLDKTGRPGSDLVDLSWPNCHRPPGRFDSGIIGVTGGLDFKPNPCLASQTGLLTHYWAYMNTGYPGLKAGRKHQFWPKACGYSDNNCLAYNYGYSAAAYAVKYAGLSNAHSDFWWLDVEIDNSWTADQSVNVMVLKGAEAAIKQYDFLSNFGYYSTIDQWQIITGGWTNHRPIWIGTGSFSRRVAEQACQEPSFSGGPVWLTQYTVGRLDKNISCYSSGPIAPSD